MDWEVETPATEGMGKCIFLVKVRSRVLRKDPNAQIAFLISVEKGEAQVKIPGFGVIADDNPFDDKCHIFPDKLFATPLFPLNKFTKKGHERVRRRLKVKLHAHENGDCLAKGVSAGFFSVEITSEKIQIKGLDLKLIVKRCK